MPTQCPICEEALTPSAVHCGGCGFPTALAPDALRLVAELAREPLPAPAEPLTEARAVNSPADPSGRLCDEEASALREVEGLVELLGGESPSAVSEMGQAALLQADGRPGEALEVLRSLRGRLDHQAGEVFSTRLRDQEQRLQALRAEHLTGRLDPSPETIRQILSRGNRQEAARQLDEATRRLAEVENSWRGLKGLLDQIETLRDAGALAATDLGEVDEARSQVRQLLDRPEIDERTLDLASQTAARALMLLHESLPPVLERELAEHAERLKHYPEGAAAAHRARTLHGEAAVHLRKGRLADTVSALRDLRQAIAQMEPAHEPPRVAPATGATEPEAAALARLLRRARELAARVRNLPPESDLAFETAAEIRRATELLKGRKLQEAEASLDRLVLTLETVPLMER